MDKKYSIMTLFTIRNTVLVALTQVGIVVVGVLASAVFGKIWNSESVPLPVATMLLLQYGSLLLFLPILWIAIVLKLRLSPLVSDDVKGLAFATGILLIAGLVIFFAYALIRPWFGNNRVFVHPATEAKWEERTKLC